MKAHEFSPQKSPGSYSEHDTSSKCDIVITAVRSPSHVRLLAIPWTAAHQASLSLTISEFAQVHVHLISDALQPSHLLNLFSPSVA